jgi:hypothetical protein
MSAQIDIIKSGNTEFLLGENQEELVLKWLYDILTGGTMYQLYFESITEDELGAPDAFAKINFDTGRVEFHAQDLFLVKEPYLVSIMDKLPAKSVPKELKTLFKKYHSLDALERITFIAKLYFESNNAELSDEFNCYFILKIERFLEIFSQKAVDSCGYGG